MMNLPNISKLYNNCKDEDYRKWKLISIDDKRELFAWNPCRIYDNVLDKTIYSDLNPNLANIFIELKKSGYIGKLSIFPNDYVDNGKIETNILHEAVETGKIFSFNISQLPEMTKLYSNKYENQLWVFVEGNEVTFEELLDEIDIEDDCVKTQMIHMQYEINDGKTIITHIDKENIYYTIEEYNERISKNVKGTGRKRVKLFKINDSCIPINYPCYSIDSSTEEKITVPFLYFVLNCFFKNEDLLREYFQKIIT